jgi:hypothetical protein
LWQPSRLYDQVADFLIKRDFLGKAGGMSDGTATTIVIALAASIALTGIVVGVALLFATSPRARAIFLKIIRNIPQ